MFILKLSMSFSLKHFFISVEISTRVASAPLTEAISWTIDGNMYIGIRIVHNSLFWLCCIKISCCCHILQSHHQLHVIRYSRVVTYHESNGSRLSIALCLFNPALDFRYSFPQKWSSLRIFLANPFEQIDKIKQLQ